MNSNYVTTLRKDPLSFEAAGRLVNKSPLARALAYGIAEATHKKWEKENHRRALKRAKKAVMPMAGVRFTDFSELKVLV